MGNNVLIKYNYFVNCFILLICKLLYDNICIYVMLYSVYEIYMYVLVKFIGVEIEI